MNLLSENTFNIDYKKNKNNSNSLIGLPNIPDTTKYQKFSDLDIGINPNFFIYTNPDDIINYHLKERNIQRILKDKNLIKVNKEENKFKYTTYNKVNKNTSNNYNISNEFEDNNRMENLSYGSILESQKNLEENIKNSNKSITQTNQGKYIFFKLCREIYGHL